MADLYGTSPSSDVVVSHDSEDFSSLINQHLQTSSSSPSCVSLKSRFMPFLHSQPQPPWKPTSILSRDPETTSVPRPSCMVDRLQPTRLVNQTLLDSAERDVKLSTGSFVAVNSTCGVKVSDPGDFFSFVMKESSENAFSSSVIVDSDINAPFKIRDLSSENDLGDYSCDSEGADVPEIPSNIDLPRGSAKRSRSAEVHNMSEKRRRRRINEKMKALQNLIPNSNKTDKASMLDEAIEYLKQLQLQVQMLSMRNGMSLQPICLPGMLQPIQLPQMGLDFDVGNAFLRSRNGIDTNPGSERCTMQSTFDLSNKSSLSDPSIVIPSIPDTTTSGSTFGFEPGIRAYNEPFNVSTNFKDDTPEVQLNCSQTEKDSADAS